MRRIWKTVAALGSSLGLLALSAGNFAPASVLAASGGDVDTGINRQVLQQSKGDSQHTPDQNGNLDVALTLTSRDQAGLDQFVQALYDPKSPVYKHFLTPDEFARLYGQSDHDIASLVQYFQSFGIQTTVYPGNLNIDLQGSLRQLSKAFNIQFHNMTYKGQSYVGTTDTPTLPAQFQGTIRAAIGLNGLSDFHTHIAHPAHAFQTGQGQSHGTSPTGLMPSALEQQYNVTPLLQRGATGAEQTIGIATLAAFHPNDAYYYWHYLGLNVDRRRIQQIPVDGGATGPIGWSSGSDETTLDVEQSGALAPGADINVYEAPNTNAGFVDLFYSVVGADQVQSMSVSWGESEDFIDPAYAASISLATEQGAAEGISMFASSGDSGAYDGYGYTLPDGTVDTSLSIDNPSDSPYITSAGGTTLPGGQTYYVVDTSGNIVIGSNGQPETFTIPIPQERVWAWDYLVPYYASFGFPDQNSLASLLFPAGGGGGFSQFFPTPWYQSGLTRPQANASDPHSGLSYALERSAPDVSMNADPQTGYNIYVSFPSDPANYLYQGWNTFGGTSFVAPQLAGLTALMNQADRTRIGFWNPQIYSLPASSGTFTDITSGDNWNFNGVPGYDEGSGLGTPNVATLGAALGGGAEESHH